VKFGSEKPPKRLEVGKVRELGLEELEGTERGRSVVKKLRDHHHMMARLFAMGMTSSAIAQAMDMSANRVSLLRSDPAMVELVQHYREMVDEDWRQSNAGTVQLMRESHARAERLRSQALEEAEDGEREIPLNTLNNIAADLADRVGFPKRAVIASIDMSFAAKLDRAIKRSQAEQIGGKVIEGRSRSPSPMKTIDLQPVTVAEAGQEVEACTPLPPAQPSDVERRRA
jgi:Fe2+ transport system protein FeoA